MLSASPFLGVSVTPVGKQVFLRVVATIPNAMLCMTTTAGMVQKAAGARKKNPPLAVKKQLIVSPSLTIPQGARIHSRCALGGYDCAPFLEKDWNMEIIWAFFLPRGEG